MIISDNFTREWLEYVKNNIQAQKYKDLFKTTLSQVTPYDIDKNPKIIWDIRDILNKISPETNNPKDLETIYEKLNSYINNIIENR